MTTIENVEVVAAWDDEAGVYVATSDSVPGLVIEAPTMDELVNELRLTIPDLLELNGRASDRELSMDIHATLHLAV